MSGRVGRMAATTAAVVAVAVLGAGCANAPTAPAAPVAPTAAPVAVPPRSAVVAAPAGVQPAPTQTVPPGGSAQPAAVPRCTSDRLAVALGAAQGAAGSVIRPLEFTNRGDQPCELRGFPGVSYVAGDNGQQVGPAAAMSGQRGSRVMLAPGGRASAALQLVEVRNFGAAVCAPTAVRGLRVYPPGETASLFVPAEGTGCAGTPPGPQLTVRTITSD